MAFNFRKIICCDCKKEFSSNWSAIRCKACRPLAEKRTQLKALKKWRKRVRKSGKHCSRCASPTGKPGICEKCSAYVLKWKASNKDKVAVIRRRRKQDSRDRHGRYLKSILSIQAGKCAQCHEPKTDWHLDHIIPKAKGGTNERINFQVLCAWCNMSKGTKVAIDYLL